MNKILLIATATMTWALSQSAAQNSSSVLQSLPEEVQKHIEDVRAACREYIKSSDYRSTNEIPSGDYGLIQFTLSGSPAVMVDNLKLCGGECYKGANCHTGGYEMAIYVRSGRTWKKAHEDGVRSGDIFLSLDWSKGDPPAFGAMVLGIPGDSKDCPKRHMFMQTSGPTAWKGSCDVIVRWNGTRFTYQPLF